MRRGAAGAMKPHPRLLAVVNTSCTGCNVCLDFCPVDCIDHEPPAQAAAAPAPPVHIRDEECIGCQVCAKVCEHLALNAIRMVPVAAGQPNG